MPRFKLILSRKQTRGKYYRAIIQTSETRKPLWDTIKEFSSTVFKELKEERRESGSVFISDENRFEFIIEPIED